jgi:hypothetical protein
LSSFSEKQQLSSSGSHCGEVVWKEFQNGSKERILSTTLTAEKPRKQAVQLGVQSSSEYNSPFLNSLNTKQIFMVHFEIYT